MCVVEVVSRSTLVRIPTRLLERPCSRRHPTPSNSYSRSGLTRVTNDNARQYKSQLAATAIAAACPTASDKRDSTCSRSVLTPPLTHDDSIEARSRALGRIAVVECGCRLSWGAEPNARGRDVGQETPPPPSPLSKLTGAPPCRLVLLIDGRHTACFLRGLSVSSDATRYRPVLSGSPKLSTSPTPEFSTSPPSKRTERTERCPGQFLSPPRTETDADNHSSKRRAGWLMDSDTS